MAARTGKATGGTAPSYVELRERLSRRDRSLRDKVRAARDSADPESLIRGISLWSCLVPGVEASEFEVIFHTRNLESIVERKLFATG